MERDQSLTALPCGEGEGAGLTYKSINGDTAAFIEFTLYLCSVSFYFRASTTNMFQSWIGKNNNPILILGSMQYTTKD